LPFTESFYRRILRLKKDFFGRARSGPFGDNVMAKVIQWWKERWQRWRGLSSLPSHLLKGRRGEALAEQWLRREAGFRVLKRNWRSGRGEIDLIGYLPDRQLVFVEVRSRQATARVSGSQSISWAKAKLLRRTAEAYLRTLKEQPAWRFDIVEIRWQSEAEPEIRHFSHCAMGRRR
jgi:putative endonuclease